MSKAEKQAKLDAIAERVEAETPDPETNSQDEIEPELEAVAAVDPGMTAACSMLVGMVGSMICGRHNLQPVTHDESEVLGSALATVAAQYDMAELSPKAAAWLGVSSAALMVGYPRYMQYLDNSKKPEAVEDEPEAATVEAGELSQADMVKASNG